MKQPLRICILECDTPLDRTRQQYGGGYAEVFKSLLRAGADMLNKEDEEAVRERLDFSHFHVQNEEGFPSLDKIDAILITGSRKAASRSDSAARNLVDGARVQCLRQRSLDTQTRRVHQKGLGARPSAPCWGLLRASNHIKGDGGSGYQERYRLGSGRTPRGPHEEREGAVQN